MIRNYIAFLQYLKSRDQSLKSWVHFLNTFIIFHLEQLILMNKHGSLCLSNLLTTFIVCTKWSKHCLCSRFLTHLHVLCARYRCNKDSSYLVMLLVKLFLSRSVFLSINSHPSSSRVKSPTPSSRISHSYSSNPMMWLYMLVFHQENSSGFPLNLGALLE